MDYKKLGLHYCHDCGAISNFCFWDGEATIDNKTVAFSGLAMMDEQAFTFELDHLMGDLSEECDSFGGEPNCPYCKSQNYWAIEDEDIDSEGRIINAFRK